MNRNNFLSHIGLELEMECTNENSKDFILHDSKKFSRLNVKRQKKTKQQKELDDIYGLSDLDMMHLQSGLRFSFSIHESYYTETWKITSMYVYVQKNSNEAKRFNITDGDFERKILYSKNIEIPFADIIKKELQ